VSAAAALVEQLNAARPCHLPATHRSVTVATAGVAALPAEPPVWDVMVVVVVVLQVSNNDTLLQ